MTASRRLFVVNQSTVLSTADVKAMVKAVNIQLRDHFAPLWHAQRVVVEYHGGTLTDVQNEVPAGSAVLGLLDNSDQAGALGWHSVDDNDRVFSEVFVMPSLNAGSGPLTGTYAVSATVSHEACELEGDPACNLYADTGRGYAIAYEDCDPVEADGYDIDGVRVSNFVTPAWFDPSAEPGAQLDYMHRCTKPFSMTPGGYWVQAPMGQESQKFGALVSWETGEGFDVRGQRIVFSPEMPEWRRELKLESGRNLVRRTRTSD